MYQIQAYQKTKGKKTRTNLADSTMTFLFYLSSPRDKEKSRSVMTFFGNFS